MIVLLKAAFTCPDPNCRLMNFNCAKCFLKEAKKDYKNLDVSISSGKQPYKELTDEKLISLISTNQSDWSCAVWRVQNDLSNGKKE